MEGNTKLVNHVAPQMSFGDSTRLRVLKQGSIAARATRICLSRTIAANNLKVPIFFFFYISRTFFCRFSIYFRGVFEPVVASRHEWVKYYEK